MLKYPERGGINDLSFGKVKGDSRYNPGKQAEIRDRVKHSIGFGEALSRHAKSEEING